MNNRRLASLFVMLSIAMVLSFLAACRAPEPPPAGPEAQILNKAVSPAGGWEEKWQRTLEQGQKEATVNVYTSAMWGAELRSSLTKAFKDKYGIGLEFTPLSGTGFVAKVKAEQNAGLYLADVFGGGSGTFLTSFKPDNLLGKIETVLILPEVRDTRAWEGGTLFNFDKEDKLWIEMMRVAARTIMYNTTLVRADEIVSFKDLLKPQFKGKIVLLDPGEVSAGTALISHFINTWGWDEGLAFFRELITTQDAAILRDARLQVETVARGKYSVLAGGSGQYKADFLNLGAPVAVKIPREGDYGTASFGGVAISTRLPHPNAAMIFVNWLLTKEGQSLFARGAGAPSRRLDASTEGIDPVFIPAPGELVRWETPEAYLARPKIMEAVKDIMRQAGK